ncbi:hypothetical protein [Actinacidiphila sp. ITFR-21]|uniref:hypothetical protein n=1 Tax=Actinacidiphila sp. ITFR-21 TaxID=3075199 RepID=UPI00288A8B65|nr:hypothetical protein [Streptomyces sp. ITFR-21]WNI15972.1 hypothetical protein RLT57_10865 [Streptomyces sp. ITFR-21]
MKVRERSAAGGGSGRQPVPAAGLGAPLDGERLPTAPRERKPALAALAVLLILVGALGATVMVMRAGNKISVVEVTAPVAAGDAIPPGAIREVMLSNDSGVNFVRWGQRKDLLNNWRAGTNLVANSVLTTSMITKKDEVIPPGKSLVGLSLKTSQFPNGLAAGNVVAAYNVSTTAAKATQDSASGAVDTTLISDRVIVKKVITSTGDFSSGDTSVTVLVDSADAGPLTIAASADTVALVLVSGKN